MKWLVFFIYCIPSLAFAHHLTGVDDQSPMAPAAIRDKLDGDIINYYREPSNLKVEEVLDIINTSDILRHRFSWEPIIGFLTVVFQDNKEHVMGWLARNNYTTYAQDVIISSLMHAKLKETALVFARAEQWKEKDLARLRAAEDDVDLKHLSILLPGHIDTLWGAFFASGDPVYVNEIIDVMTQKTLPYSDKVTMPAGYGPIAVRENKELATKTLSEYAITDHIVRKTLSQRVMQDPDFVSRMTLQKLLPEK